MSSEPSPQASLTASQEGYPSFHLEHERALVALAKLRANADLDLLSVPTARSSTGFASRTTVVSLSQPKWHKFLFYWLTQEQGIMLAGCTVDNLVVGSSADLSNEIEKGDKIVKVDGIPVTDYDVRQNPP